MVASLKSKIQTYFTQTPIQVAIHEILVSLFLLTLPFYVPAPRNIAWVIISLNAIIALLLHQNYRKNLWKYKHLFFLLSFFLLLHFIGMFHTQNTEWGWFLIGLLVPLWSLPLSMQVFPTPKITLQNYLRLFVIGVAIFALLCYARAFYRVFQDWHNPHFEWANYFYYQNFTAFRAEPTYLAMLICLANLFLLTDLFFPQHLSIFYSNKTKALFLGFFLLTMLLLAARTQIGIFILGFAVFFLEYFRKQNKIWQGLLWGIAIIGILIGIILLTPYTRKRFSFLWNTQERIILDKNQDHSLGRNWDGATLRFAQWTCAQELIQKNWLLGVGTGDGQDELQKIYDEYKFYFASKYNRYNAHNQFFETWIALGIVGFIGWLALLVLPLSFFWKEKNYLAWSIWLVLFFSAFTESYLQRNYGVIVFAIFYGIAFLKHSPNQFERAS
ncbi:O-antigen ligase family protein [Raineya sp.]